MTKQAELGIETHDVEIRYPDREFSKRFICNVLIEDKGFRRSIDDCLIFKDNIEYFKIWRKAFIYEIVTEDGDISNHISCFKLFTKDMVYSALREGVEDILDYLDRSEDKISYIIKLSMKISQIITIMDKLHNNRDSVEFRNFINSTIISERKKKTKKGYVYIIHTDHSTKVGRSKNVKTRIGAIGTQLPHKILWTESFKVDDMYNEELKLHEEFKDKRINGEWFDLSDEDITIIKNRYI